MYDECSKYCNQRKCPKFQEEGDCEIAPFCNNPVDAKPDELNHTSIALNLAGISLEKAYERINRTR